MPQSLANNLVDLIYIEFDERYVRDSSGAACRRFPGRLASEHFRECRMPTLFSYVVDHDYGFAPCPVDGFCTLAKCTYGSKNRKNILEMAQKGDWIAGTGGQTSVRALGMASSSTPCGSIRRFRFESIAEATEAIELIPSL